MDKIAAYKEVIYKEAMARAWKKGIGELSEAALSKLRQSGILDHEKELRGLEKGTENIVKRHGGVYGKITADEFADNAAGALKDNKKINKLLKDNGLSMQDFRDGMKSSHIANGGNVSYVPPNNKGRRMVSKGDIHAPNSPLPSMFGEHLPMKDSFEHRYTNAIINRHEADEVRFGANQLKGHKNNVVADGDKFPTGTIMGHLSPKVIGSESANVAVAPKSVKDGMMALRGNSGERMVFGQNGLQYGQSGKYNKQLNNKLFRKVRKSNKPDLKEAYK